MFDFLFGWRKASKCKRLVKRVQCRLKLLRNKRSSIARLVRDDVAQLILAGHQHIAFNRTEQLCDDLSLISAYELLDQFCEFILSHLSYIRKHKDIPNDINEAISSLIFASARCGNIPELQRIRKLFAERYGQRFATAAVELFHGNLVNHQIKEKLSAKAVHDDEKQTLFDEIARGCSAETDPLAIEFASEMQEHAIKEKLSRKPLPAEVEDILVLEFASELQKQEKESSKKQILDNYTLTYHNEDKGCQIQDSKSTYSLSAGNKCSSRSCQPSRQNSDMTTTSVSSSILRQSSYIASGEEEEIENALTVTGRTYATNSASSSESSYHCHDEILIYLDDIEEFESPKAKDQDQRLFMFKPSMKGAHNENVKSRGTQKCKKEFDSWKCRQNSSNECSLEHPCYYCTGDEKDVWEVPMSKQKRGHQHDNHVAAAVYDAFTYPDTRGRIGERKEVEAAPPYRRAATMPQERPKDGLGGIMERWNSCPYKKPNHVHPKLPDYDDIAAKFRALKEDHHQIKLSDRVRVV